MAITLIRGSGQKQDLWKWLRRLHGGAGKSLRVRLNLIEVYIDRNIVSMVPGVGSAYSIAFTQIALHRKIPLLNDRVFTVDLFITTGGVSSRLRDVRRIRIG